VLVVAVFVGLAIINGMKGKWWMALVFGHGLFGIITAIRLAKPNSYWYRKLYADAKRVKADMRFAPGPVQARMEAVAAKARSDANAAKNRREGRATLRLRAGHRRCV
jgi:hypothetical protein